MTKRRMDTVNVSIPPDTPKGFAIEREVMLPAGVIARDAVVRSPDHANTTPHRMIGIVHGLPLDDDRPINPRRYLIVRDGADIDAGKWRHVRTLVFPDNTVVHVLEESAP